MHEPAADRSGVLPATQTWQPRDRTASATASLEFPQRAERHTPVAHGANPCAGGAPSITIRRARPDDAARLAQFYQDLSPRSRYRRFLGVVNELPAAVIRRFVDSTGPEGTTLLVFRPDVDGSDVVVGEARYAMARGGHAAEFALAVVDSAQGLGLGRCLLQALMREAASHGIETLQGDVLPDNEPMLALARALGFDERRDRNDPRLRTVERRIDRPAEAATLV